jgi:hypothetical protein
MSPAGDKLPASSLFFGCSVCLDLPATQMYDRVHLAGGTMTDQFLKLLHSNHVDVTKLTNADRRARRMTG